MKTDSTEKSGEQISRKEALKKAGKYAAFTAAAAVIMLTPAKAEDTSLPDDPGSGGSWGGGSNPVAPPPRGGKRPNSPFIKPEPSSSQSGLKDSPWK